VKEKSGRKTTREYLPHFLDRSKILNKKENLVRKHEKIKEIEKKT
jgi:hypothetical protein